MLGLGQLGSLGLLNPDSQDILDTLQIYPDGQVGALIYHPSFTSHLDRCGIQIQNRIYLLERPALPFLDIIYDSIGNSRDEIRRYPSKP